MSCIHSYASRNDSLKEYIKQYDFQTKFKKRLLNYSDFSFHNKVHTQKSASQKEITKKSSRCY